MTRFVVVPQWQGSASSRAMQLVDGADAVAGDLPASATTRVDVPLEAGETLGTGIRRWSSLRRIGEAVADAIAVEGDRVLVVGGDGSVSVPAVLAHAARRPAVLRLSPRVAFGRPSADDGAYEHVAVRALVDPEVPAVGGERLDPARILVAGARDADADQLVHADARGVLVERDVDPDALVAWAAGTGADALVVHLDLAVLDPGDLRGLTDPVPFGPSVADLAAAVRAVRERLPLLGAVLTGYSPATPDMADDDLGTILRLVGALA